MGDEKAVDNGEDSVQDLPVSLPNHSPLPLSLAFAVRLQTDGIDGTMHGQLMPNAGESKDCRVAVESRKIVKHACKCGMFAV